MIESRGSKVSAESVVVAPNRYEIESFRVKLASESKPDNEVGIRLKKSPRREQVNDLVRSIYAQLEPDQEHGVVLFVNTFNRITGYRVIASGDRGSVNMTPDRVLRDALLAGANAIVVVHNHPNGLEKPSPSDVTALQRLIVAAGALDVPVLDALVLAQGTGEVFSFDEAGLLRQVMDPRKLNAALRPGVNPLTAALNGEVCPSCGEVHGSPSFDFDKAREVVESFLRAKGLN